MNKNIIVVLMLIISSICANESTLDSNFTEDMRKDNMQFINYNIQQVKQMNCDVFKLNWKIQDFVTENLQNNNNAIVKDLQNLSINSITFSLSIYNKNSCNIYMYANNIKTILSNLLNKNLNNNKLEQINKDFLNICNILYNKKDNLKILTI